MSVGKILSAKDLRELMTGALVFRGNCSDCNDIANLRTGIYRTDYSSKNTPDRAEWGYMIVIKERDFKQGAVMLHIAIELCQVSVRGYYQDMEQMPDWRILT